MTTLAANHWNWALDGWIVAAAVLCALSCALLGNFLVLRRMSMMGDAISHAVLPGLAVAFLITGSRDSWPMFVGAALVGVLTAVLTQWVTHFGKVEESASMGVVFTALFAIGLILIVRAADHVDLDPGCVLYGAVETIAVDAIGGGVPTAVWKLGGVLVLNALVVAVFYKELKITSFDPELATTLGISAGLMHYLLMTLVAVTTVASFEMVGSVLVVAMLIVPAATAHLLTDRLGAMIAVSLVVAFASAVGGHLLAATVPAMLGWPDTNTAGMMAVVAGALLTVAVLASPRHGVISKLVHRALLSVRIAREDVLGLLYRLEELDDRPGPHAATGGEIRTMIGIGPMLGRLALRGLVRAGELERAPRGTRGANAGDASGAGDAVGYQMTSDGRHAARQLVRSHRLWEGFLVQHLNLPPDHVHAPAERLEHVTSAAMREELDERMERPATDPQGKVIPPK
jgi:manganese/zinc/iron transport system permease protein